MREAIDDERKRLRNRPISRGAMHTLLWGGLYVFGMASAMPGGMGGQVVGLLMTTGGFVVFALRGVQVRKLREIERDLVQRRDEALRTPSVHG